MKRSYREYQIPKANPIEQAEQAFTTKVNGLLNELAFAIADMPKYTSLPKDLQTLVGQVAKGYVIMTDGARAYARSK
jgi:hypothetical protein